MFSHISKNWRGRPLISYETVVNLIANTTTTTGPRMGASLDDKAYPTGIKVSDEELEQVRIVQDDWHGDWSYAIEPRQLRLL